MNDEQMRRYEFHARVMASHVIAADALELLAEVKRLRAELAAAPRWVPVTEALPKFGEDNTVLVQAHGSRFFAWLGRDGKWLTYDERIYENMPAGHVTHWMDIPDTPD